MRLKVIIGAGLLLATMSCAARIRRVPIAAEDRIQAHRLAIEGSQLLLEGKDHLALLRFVEASTFNPYDAVIFNKLAITYCRLLRFREADRAIQRSMRLDPEYANAYNTRGILYLAAQKEGKAVRSFRKAIALEPGKAIFHLNLGTAYLNRGQYREGRDAYHRAVEIDAEVFKMEGAIQISASSASEPEKFYQLSLLFAELGDRANSLFYLSKALAEGFRDARRLASEPALAGFRQERDFLNLVQSYGLDLGAGRIS